MGNQSIGDIRVISPWYFSESNINIKKKLFSEKNDKVEGGEVPTNENNVRNENVETCLEVGDHDENYGTDDIGAGKVCVEEGDSMDSDGHNNVEIDDGCVASVQDRPGQCPYILLNT